VLGLVVLVSEAAPPSAAAGAAGAAGPSGAAPALREATMLGDLCGLAGSACLALYFSVSARVRRSLPVLFAWLAVLSAVGAAVATAAGLALEGARADYQGASALAALAGGDRRSALLALGAALTASTVGHGVANFALRFVSPLVVSVAFLAQPLIAAAQGAALQLQGPLTARALAAAPLLIVGAYLTTVGGRERGLTLADAARCRLTRTSRAAK
jgi:drug/metabolite transporter (DMT)-like permease